MSLDDAFDALDDALRKLEGEVEKHKPDDDGTGKDFGDPLVRPLIRASFRQSRCILLYGENCPRNDIFWTCDKTKEDCKMRGNLEHFSGITTLIYKGHEY